jgi:predicted nucleic acid-binding protein
MVSAVDSSVLLDVLLADATFGLSSKSSLRNGQSQGALIISECVVAEILPVLPGGAFEEFAQEFGLSYRACESAILAGEMFSVYLRRGGKPGRVVADFLIGAHAQLQADRLIARDLGFYRDYFKGLKVCYPA